MESKWKARIAGIGVFAVMYLGTVFIGVSLGVIHLGEFMTGLLMAAWAMDQIDPKDND